MTLYQNIHPSYAEEGKRKWERVFASFKGPGLGECITLFLMDQNEHSCEINIHYGDDAEGLLNKLKIAILMLPVTIEKEKKNPVGFKRKEYA